jgi:hypothetical protein
MKKRHLNTGRFSARIAMFRSVVAITTLLITGCATIQQLGFEEPDFNLTSVRIDGLGLTGGSLTLLIEVDNPNSYDLRTGQIDVAIDLEGTRFGEAFLDGSTRFGSRTITPIELPLSFKWAGVGTGARSIVDRGGINYKLLTRLSADTPLGNRLIEITTRGNVPVEQLIR